MPTKLIQQIQTSITGAAVLMAGATIVSRLLGLIRDRLFAHTFGAGTVLDAYYASFKIPDLLFGLIIMGALSAGFIPVFTKYRNTHGLEKAWSIVHTMLGYAGVLLVIGGVLLFAFADPLISIVAPGFDTTTHILAVNFTRILFLSPILLGVSAVFGGVLQSMHQFFVFSIAPIFYNLGIILGIVVLYPLLGNEGITWGVVLGAFMHACIQFWAIVRLGFPMRISFALSPEVKRIVYLMIPRTLGLAVNQISLIAMIAIASTLSAGSISAFQLAHNIAFVPIGVFAISYAVASFPKFCETADARRSKIFVQHFSSTVRQVLFLLIPSTVIFVILRAQIVRVLLGSGAFDWEDTVMTFDSLAMFAIGFIGLGLVHVLVRAFYAFEDTKTPVMIAIIVESVAVSVAFFSSKILGVQGIALAISLASLLQIASLAVLLQRKIHTLDGARITIAVFKMTLCALLMAIVMQYTKAPIAQLVDMTSGIGVFIQMSVVALLGGLVYVLAGLLLRMYEMRVFMEVMRKKLIHVKFLPDDVTDTL